MEKNMSKKGANAPQLMTALKQMRMYAATMYHGGHRQHDVAGSKHPRQQQQQSSSSQHLSLQGPRGGPGGAREEGWCACGAQADTGGAGANACTGMATCIGCGRWRG
jgi:hypothetical protein